jgi:site-specific recombinase XerD
VANNSNLDQAINDYLLWLIDTGYAESTIYNYERKLIHFQDYIGSGTDSLDAILSYKIITVYERDSTLKDCTVSVWGLARYLYQNERLTELPGRKPKNLPILYETYLSDSQTNRSISAQRISGCRNTLQLFSDWLTRQGCKLQQLHIEQVDHFLAEISKNYAPETMQRHRSSLRGFLNWLYRNNIIRRNLALLVVGPPQYAVAKPPRFLRADEIKKLFMVIPATPKEQRTLAMLHLAYYLGLRPVEISRISLDDIMFSKQEILLPTRKSCNPIAVPLPMVAIKAIADYVINVRPESDSRKLFLGLYAPYEPVKSFSVCSTISAWMRKAGAPGSAYWLRHTYAQNLLEAKASIFEIKEMLGHDRIQTTSRYLRIHVTMMREVLFNEAI